MSWWFPRGALRFSQVPALLMRSFCNSATHFLHTRAFFLHFNAHRTSLYLHFNSIFSSLLSQLLIVISLLSLFCPQGFQCLQGLNDVITPKRCSDRCKYLNCSIRNNRSIWDLLGTLFRKVEKLLEWRNRRNYSTDAWVNYHLNSAGHLKSIQARLTHNRRRKLFMADKIGVAPTHAYIPQFATLESTNNISCGYTLLIYNMKNITCSDGVIAVATCCTNSKIDQKSAEPLLYVTKFPEILRL